MDLKIGRVKVLIGFAILLITIVAYYFYQVKKDKFLDQKVPQLVEKKTHNLYNISYDSIAVNELQGNVFIRNIVVTGDTSLQLQMINNKDTNAASILFNMYIPSIEVVKFRTAAAILSKQLECKEVIITNPQLTIYLFPGQKIQKDNKKFKEELYKQILGNFKLIKAEKISVVNSEVLVSDFYTKEIKFRSKKTTIDLSEVAIDSTYNQDTTRTLFSKEIHVNSEKVILGDKKNTAELSNAVFSTRSKRILFSSFEYDAFKNNGIFKSSFQNVSFEGIEWQGPVENSDLVIDKMFVEKAEIETLSGEKNKKKSNPKTGKILTGWVRNFSLNFLQLKNVTFKSKSNTKNERPMVIKNSEFILKNIEIDRSTALDESLINHAKEIEFSNKEINIASSDGFYNYRIGGIKLNTRTKVANINYVMAMPTLSEAAFAKKAVFQVDRYDIKFKDIKVKNIEVAKLLKGQIEVGSISTSGSSIKIFRDLTFPSDSLIKGDRKTTFPGYQVANFGPDVDIKNFINSNTYIEYKERSKRSASIGRLRFSNTHINVQNITNRSSKRNGKMMLKFNTRFLEKVFLTGEMTFSLDQWQKGDFTASAATRQSFDADIINQLTVPLALIKVETGRINGLNFNIRGDNKSASGSLELPYEDLKISLLAKNEKGIDKKSILSTLVNLAVKNDNKKVNNIRNAKIYVLRKTNHSYFKFVWTTILEGIRSIAIVKI